MSKVLILDRSQFTSQETEKLVSGLGYEALVTEQAKNAVYWPVGALVEIEKEKPDCVIIDETWSRESLARDIIGRIRGDHPDLPIIACITGAYQARRDTKIKVEIEGEPTDEDRYMSDGASATIRGRLNEARLDVALSLVLGEGGGISHERKGHKDRGQRHRHVVQSPEFICV